MFRRVSTVALVVVVAHGSIAVVTAAEPKEAISKTKSLPKELMFDLGKGVKLEMVLIPAGEFIMGAPDSDKYAFPEEKPQHRVWITKPFYLGKYPVTQEQWQSLTGQNKSFNKGAKNPVEGVSWDYAHLFLRLLNAKMGMQGGKFVLPSEAQWEYACRAGSTTRYSFGDDEKKMVEYGWCHENSGGKTHPVGGKKPNAWGLFDMHGNVWEWCRDRYDEGYYSHSPADDPPGPPEGRDRVLRGGKAEYSARGNRSTVRGSFYPDSELALPDSFVGFRIALLPADKGPLAAEPTLAPPKQITNSIGMKLTLIPSGEFMMGSKESAEETAAFFSKAYGEDFLNAGCFKDEHPQHRVRITKPFYLGTQHVTRGQFRQFVIVTGYQTDAEKEDVIGATGWALDTKKFAVAAKYYWLKAGFEQTDDHPVVYVSWNDAVAFCKWLSKKEGKSYRLPTEAEWEYACRAGTMTRYYSGDDPETLAKVGNVADATLKAKFPVWKYTIKTADGYTFTAPVGKFNPNAFGLYDMHGNVEQWCADWFGEYYYTNSPVHDPTGPDSGRDRVLRGGSWCYWPDYARSAGRDRKAPDFRSEFTGFRVARTQ